MKTTISTQHIAKLYDRFFLVKHHAIVAIVCHIVVILASFLIVACPSGQSIYADGDLAMQIGTGPGADTTDYSTIRGIKIPIAMRDPVANITSNKQYSGDVHWYAVGAEELEADFTQEPLTETGTLLHSPGTFVENEYYKAVIIISPHAGYRMPEQRNYFKVAGAVLTSYEPPTNTVRAYFAQTPANVFSVTFDNNGATTISSNTGYTAKEGQALRLPHPPQKTGYVFGGWFPSTGTQIEVDSSKIVTGDLSLKAKWLSYVITVEFYRNTNDAAASYPDTETIRVISPATTLSSLPSPLLWSGHNMRAWNTESDASGYIIDTNTDMRTVTAEAVDRDHLAHTVSAYALWYEGACAVLFDANGGTKKAPNPSIKSVAATGGNVGSLPAAPEKHNYDFAGWNTQANGGGSPFSASTAVNANIVVYAQWNFSAITITYNYQGATGGNTITSKAITSLTDAVGTLPTPTKSNFIFDGWYTAANGNGLEITETSVVTADTTVYAFWKFDKYTVTFDSNSATVASVPATRDITVQAGGTVVLPSKPKKTNYVFGGWYIGTGGTGEAFDTSTPVAEDKTLYAKWITPSTIGWSYDAATDGMNKNFAYSSTAQTFTPPLNGSYTFELWGANGGNSRLNTVAKGLGGTGGYTKGTLSLTTTENLYIFTGGKGADVNSVSGDSGTGGAAGSNGGGKGGNKKSGEEQPGGAGGGGGTDLRTANNATAWGTRILVAGGGGGGAGSNNAANVKTGGNGGGEAGGNGSATGVAGGTQTSGYAEGIGLMGSNGDSSGHAGRGGGGGGYWGGYGGGAGSNSSGAGGSGYIGGVPGKTVIGGLTVMSGADGFVTSSSSQGNVRVTYIP